MNYRPVLNKESNFSHFYSENYQIITKSFHRFHLLDFTSEPSDDDVEKLTLDVLRTFIQALWKKHISKFETQGCNLILM